MRPNVPKRRPLLIAFALPLLWVASVPLAYCVCPSGRIAMVSGGECMGCDCSCCHEHSCCRASQPETSEGDETTVRSQGCRRGVAEPSFTSAVNFEWSQPQPDVWIERLPPRLVASINFHVVTAVRHTILPNSKLYLQHGVLLL